MKIEIWSDYVCPFCYIGKRRMEEALRSTQLENQAEVEFKAYQLDPNTPEDSNQSMVAGLAKKYGVSLQEAERMVDNVAEQAKTVGLLYNSKEMKVSNTFNAHRLAKLAEQEGKAAEVTERLMQAHFIDAEAIGKKDVLVRIAEEAGISSNRARQALDTDEFTDDVKRDITEAGQLGIQGVPFFVINRKYAISGAQPAAVFEEALRKVAQEEGVQPAFQVLGDDEDGVCKDDNCSI
ncbi:DsbA family protein [Sporosarcina sp. Te-1]|uniref:DsbA family oxidoreductase n=1 Tax=Sporosarcina sp. Te-1 TaxID=2818390 RepID=UPI001A9E8C2B|nr:DsbA family oxidoreductase [Sporosarcina sp. Te-1]QTD39625.1 DsbA family oxidoreductase [Sporosarcina sp. Te-1]